MIDVKNVEKSYGSGESICRALRGVSLKIDEGGFAVILGASGSGKSTLLSVMSGLERADSGKVICGGRDISSMSEKELTAFRRENVGFVFQQYYLLSNMNVDGNVKMGAELAGNKAYREVIEAVGLKEKLRKYPSELSGGEQQRVAVARALAKKPKILFLDEPTGALDESSGRMILDCVSRMKNEYGFIAVMVTHNQNISEMADTVIKMNSGKIYDIQTNAVRKSAYEIGW